jgi:hypothetical protein
VAFAVPIGAMETNEFGNLDLPAGEYFVIDDQGHEVFVPHWRPHEEEPVQRTPGEKESHAPGWDRSYSSGS